MASEVVGMVFGGGGSRLGGGGMGELGENVNWEEDNELQVWSRGVMQEIFQRLPTAANGVIPTASDGYVKIQRAVGSH